MRRSIPGKKKYDPFKGIEEIKETEIPSSKLREKLNYGIGHYAEKKSLERKKEMESTIVYPGKARCEKPGYTRPKWKHGKPSVTAKVAQQKLRERAEKEQIEKGMDYIQTLDLKAKAICDIEKKFYALGVNNTKKTEEVVLEILNRIARGETLTQICRSENMPSSGTVQKWIKTDPDFQKAFIEAREFQMNTFADQILELADNSVGDIRMAFDKYGNVIPDVCYENIKRSELRIKTRQWLMERMHRSQYQKVAEAARSPEGEKQKSGNVLVQIMLPDNGRPIADARILEM